MQGMKKPHIFAIVIIAVVLGCGVFGLVTVTRVIDQVRIDQIQLQAVQTGVEATAKDFPILDGVDIIRNTSVTSTSLTVGSFTCYYGEATLVSGSQLSEAQILDRYTSLLKPYGYYLWPPDDTTNLARRFERGFYESVVIEGILDAFVGGNYGVDLEQIKKKYASVMYISMVYSLPKLKGCY